MRVLITGGAGYIGSELTSRLAKTAGVGEIVVYDNLSRGNFNLFFGDDKLGGGVRLLRADLLDSRTLRLALKTIDIVIHLAAKVTTPFADQTPHFFEQINHWGTAELVYAVEASDVSKLIFLSSASVYGASSSEVDANSPANPKTFYGVSKRRGEQHVQRLMTAGFPAYVIRCGNVFGYGRSLRFDSVINRFMFEANYLGRIAIHGTGRQHRSFVHVDRVARVITSLLQADCPAPGTYNLVEATWSINTIAETIRAIYPQLDMIFADRDVEMRELKVKPDPRLDHLLPNDPCSLLEHLVDFNSAMSFHHDTSFRSAAAH